MLYVFLRKEFGQILENRLAVKRDELLPADLKSKRHYALRLHPKIFIAVYIRVFVTILTVFITSTVHGCVQKQSCTDINVIPTCSQYMLVNIMWEESNEWMKLGAKAFFCFIVSSFL